VSFGLRCANWLVGIVEAALGLRSCRERLTLQFGGPVGTLDRFGGKGLELAEAVAVRLGLPEEIVPWHSTRTRIAQLGAALAIAAGAATKIALDIVLLSQSGIGEVAEATGGPSSSMPHKRNPIRSIEARATFAGAVAQAGVLLSAVPGELERSAGSWQSEWSAISYGFKLTHATVAHTKHAITGLQVYPGRMLANLTEAKLASPDLGAIDLIIDRALTFYSERMK